MYPRLLEIPLPFEIFGIEVITIYSFGAMMAIAFLLAAWLLRTELDRLYHEGRLNAVRMQIPAPERWPESASGLLVLACLPPM